MCDDGRAADPPAVDDALRAGLALYHAGRYHAAHEPWEAAWLPLDGGPDADLLQGLIQFTAAIHHARDDNPSGATGLARSAPEYLDGLGSEHRGVTLPPVREFARRVAADPGTAVRESPPAVRVAGDAPTPASLDLDGVLLVAPALAGAVERVDERVVADGVAFARDERGTGRTRYAGLLTDFVTDPDARPVAYARLGAHVERERSKKRDVDGLF